MHASLAFVNGAGNRRRSRGSRTEGEELRLLNTLLSMATSGSPRPAVDEGRSDDPAKPNEVRERHLNKIMR